MNINLSSKPNKEKKKEKKQIITDVEEACQLLSSDEFQEWMLKDEEFESSDSYEQEELREETKADENIIMGCLELAELFFDANSSHPKIEIDSTRKEAKMTIDPEKVSGACVLKQILSPCLIEIEITGCASWIAVGISDFKTLEGKKWELTDKEIESMKHGCYMVSNNGYKWSRSDKSENFKKGFKFKEGDIIGVEFLPDEKKLVILKYGGYSTRKVEFNINIKNADKLFACVILGGTGDSAEIKSYTLLE
mmetsp:Transcript_58368/g.49270  ORF Transcript_58368/g.49270 Transcript_58368/m.49270 type:complete len:251 (+) Transcript_58368:164-916(+)